MKELKIVSLSIILIFLTWCKATSQNSYYIPDNSFTPCEFTNPVNKGADPWVFKKNGFYYFIESTGGAIQISRSENLTDIKSDPVTVWEQPTSGWNKSNIWAPELFHIDGKWYIYYTAGESGPPFIHQRSGVLESVTDDPMGQYRDRGKLYTGDNIETGDNNKWAIDFTVLDHEDQLYGIWSGWEKNEETDRTPQHLYIAEMENPWTISSNRVRISSPEEDWEAGSELAINEGPQIFKNYGRVFIIYSASESWLPDYNLGQLSLKKNGEPIDPISWVKEGSVFSGTDDVHGVGHASFTSSPDHRENWILYHTKVSKDPGWDRTIHMQSFQINDDGSPNFGKPVSPGEVLRKPSGECNR